MISFLENRIIQADLTKTGRKIAEYFLQNASRICFMTVQDVAREVKVSDASVIRAARVLGFSGFSAMQRQLQDKAKGVLETNNVDFIPPIEKLTKYDPALGENPLSAQRLAATCASLQCFLDNNNPEKIEAAVQIILSSRKRLVTGSRASSCVARYLFLMLGLLLPDVILGDPSVADIIDKIMYFDNRDCVIILAFPRYLSLEKQIAEMAKDAGIRIIVITDKPTSPIASGADVVITAPSNRLSMFSSVIAAQYAAETIVEMVTQRVAKKNQKALIWKEKQNKTYHVFL